MKQELEICAKGIRDRMEFKVIEDDCVRYHDGMSPLAYIRRERNAIPSVLTTGPDG